jgi:hypothetical protein
VSKLESAEELQAKEKSLKSSGGYMSPEEIEMAKLKHEAKLDDAKVIGKLIKALKVQFNAAELQKLKSSMKHLSNLLGYCQDLTLGKNKLLYGSNTRHKKINLHYFKKSSAIFLHFKHNNFDPDTMKLFIC